MCRTISYNFYKVQSSWLSSTESSCLLLHSLFELFISSTKSNCGITPLDNIHCKCLVDGMLTNLSHQFCTLAAAAPQWTPCIWHHEFEIQQFFEAAEVSRYLSVKVPMSSQLSTSPRHATTHLLINVWLVYVQHVFFFLLELRSANFKTKLQCDSITKYVLPLLLLPQMLLYPCALHGSTQMHNGVLVRGPASRASQTHPPGVLRQPRLASTPSSEAEMTSRCGTPSKLSAALFCVMKLCVKVFQFFYVIWLTFNVVGNNYQINIGWNLLFMDDIWYSASTTMDIVDFTFIFCIK
jgi:hypothetical protein